MSPLLVFFEGDILDNLMGGVRGEAVHDQKGGLLDILADMIHIFLHQRNVHALDRIFI